jgi:hypothetical protein
MLASTAAQSQDQTRVTVSFNNYTVNGQSVPGGPQFACTGTPVCRFEGQETLTVTGCSNALVFNYTATMTGLNLAQSGPIQGTIAYGVGVPDVHADGTCSIAGVTTFSFPYTGNWNSSSGTGSLNISRPTCIVEGQDVCSILDWPPFTGSIRSEPLVPPVFPMTVTSNITATSATASAQIQFRPQDVGQQGSVFVFALAPATRVVGAQAAGVMKVGYARGGKKADTPVACVLSQLGPSGQMVAVSAQNLDAYSSGVLSAQGASVSILDNVPTPNVAGATFFVGYGPDAGTMIDTGVNRAAVSVPGSLSCVPSRPQTGWWWNPLEDGRGYSVEVRGNNIFFASFLYDVSGRSAWYVSTGPVSLEGSYYSGALLNASGGQTLGGAYPGRPMISPLGNMTLTFHNASSGTLVWPGGTVPIQRFNIVTNGLNLPPVAGQPESGWWWNPDEDGRGFFMEWQNGWLDIAGYMYDEAGNPVWYLTVGQIGGTSAARSFSGNWWSYGNGMTLYGPWRPNQQTSNNVAPLAITFTSATSAVMTLPNGRTTILQRHRF